MDRFMFEVGKFYQVAFVDEIYPITDRLGKQTGDALIVESQIQKVFIISEVRDLPAVYLVDNITLDKRQYLFIGSIAWVEELNSECGESIQKAVDCS